MKIRVYWGWVVCLCFLLLFTVSAGVAFSFGEVMIPLNRELHQSIALLGWIGSLPASLPMLLAPVGTICNYKFGTRNTVMLGVFIVSLALACTAMVHNMGLLFLFYGVFVGLGLILIVNPPFFLLEEYFPYDHHRHVLATSIIACGFPLATLIFNPITYVLLESVKWRLTYTIYAVLVFVLGIGSGLTFRHKHKKEIDPAYEEHIAARAEKGDDNQDSQQIKPEQLVIAKRTKIILGTLWVIASTLKSMGYYTPFVTLVKQMDVLGIPQEKSAQAMSVIGGCELCSRVLISYTGDYFKGKILYMYVICTFALCIQNALGTMAYSFSHLVAYAAALGIFGGPVIAAMYSSCSEVLDGQYVPGLFTAFRVGLGLGALVGPTLAGFIFDSTNSFLGVFYVNSVTYFLTSVLYMVIIYLNKYKPTWCFPDGNEELSLVQNRHAYDNGFDSTNTSIGMTHLSDSIINDESLTESQSEDSEVG